MHRQAGVAQVVIVAVVAVLALVGGGVFIWRSAGEVDRLQTLLSSARADLDKARADAKKATSELAITSKELSTLKVTAERLTAERDAVRGSMAQEQANGVQLRSELQLAKDQVSYLSARSSKDIVRGMPRTPTTPVK